MTTPAHTAALDSAKFALYESKNDGAFLGALLCNMETLWDGSIPTACTNGLTLKINPDWFIGLINTAQATIIEHELWHVGHVHPVRGQSMQPRRFNMAADYVVNLQMSDDGHTFAGLRPLLDKQYRGMTVEQVYDVLPPDEDGSNGSGGCWSDDPDDMDMSPDTTPEELSEILSVVQTAVIAQERTGYMSKEVQAISDRIRNINKPKVNWKTETRDFCQDKARAGLDYTRRNRRYKNVILPARGKRGRLIELAYLMDVSGSVTDDMAEQMYAEIVYIWETLKPKCLHIVQFDTSIRKVDTWTQGHIVNDIEIVGRGGTSLGPVANWLEQHKPNGAIIMSDLECSVMREVKNVPILWLCINNPYAKVNQGKLIHIEV
jgi:predicted metal-dependent peptidase